MNDELLTFGRKVERRVADSLRRMYLVMIPADIPVTSGLGPRLCSDTQQIVMADLQIFGPRHGWLEVKYKAKANHRRNENIYEHGIDLDKWRQYLALRDSTRLPFYLLICEGSTGTMLMQDSQTLESTHRVRYGEWSNNYKESINWDRRVFEQVGRFVIPHGDVDAMIIRWDWDTLNTFLSQLALFSFAE